MIILDTGFGTNGLAKIYTNIGQVGITTGVQSNYKSITRPITTFGLTTKATASVLGVRNLVGSGGLAGK